MKTPDKEQLHNAEADAALEEYLSRNSPVSQRYRELEGGVVPPSLDAAVLAQARNAVAAKKDSRWRSMNRWSAPLALAASVVVVVSLVLQPATQREITSSDAPAAVPPQAFARESQVARKQEAAVADATGTVERRRDELLESVPAEPEVAAPARIEQSAASSLSGESKIADADKRAAAYAGSSIRQTAAMQSAPAPAAAPSTSIRTTTSTREPPPLASTTGQGPLEQKNAGVAAAQEASGLEDVMVTARERSTTQRVAGPRDTVPARSQHDAAMAAGEKSLREDEAARWLEHIRQLRRDGEARRADREWRRFLARYPDYFVDETDLARANK